MNIHLQKKVYNLDFWWFLYHPFFVWPFCDAINTKIEANQDIFPSATDRRSWSPLFVAEFVCDELKPSEERERIEGWNSFGNSPEIFSISKTIHWRYFKIPKDTFPRLPDLWIFTGRHGDTLKDDTSSSDFWYVSTCFHILQPCLNKLHFIGYHLGTSWNEFSDEDKLN